MNQVPFYQTKINDGFWKIKQDMVKDTTVHAVYNRFTDTHRFDALRCQWKKEGAYEAHYFWDSDVAKWIEGVAYILEETSAPDLEAICDQTIEEIIKNSDENGYFNCYFLCTRQDERFTNRDCHELYCAGHLMEAAVAYYKATGKDAFLKAMCRFADYIERVFKIENSASFVTPGHPELELALVRLYQATGETRYLELSKYFIDQHGNNEKDLPADPKTTSWANNNYNQDISPLREISTAEGHCVRALYLLCGMIDIATAYQDQELFQACKRAFENIVNKRMYITGSVGSTHIGETFTIDYHLPNRTAYTETCAAISLALFAGRMQNTEIDSRYADTVERAIYNGVLSGVSMDGKSFFYENPLEIDPKFNNVNPATTTKERYPITQRLEVFGCSCCPPNIVRFIPSIANFLYSTSEDTVFVHQYMDSETKYEDLHLIQKTQYPVDGNIHISCDSSKKWIALRIPGWCTAFQLNHNYELKNGYAFISLNGHTEIDLNLEMPVVAISANRQVHDCAGRIAIQRGPIVYCVEGVDNGDDLKCLALDPNGSYTLSEAQFLVPNIQTTGYLPASSDALYSPLQADEQEVPVTLIPYFAFANRGTTEMQVWILKK